MESEPGVRIVHRIPGRVRLVVEPIRRDPARAERVAELARGGRWVLSARADAVTASLVIEHDPAAPLGDVLAVLAPIPELSACGACSIEDLCRRRPAAPPGRPDPASTAGFLLRTADRVNAASTSLTTPHADLKLLVPAALLAFGVVRIYAGRSSPVPSWMVLFKYGFDTFAVLNQGVIRSFIKERLARAADPAAGAVAP